MPDDERDDLLRKQGRLEGQIIEIQRALEPKRRDRFLSWTSAATTLAGILLAPPTGGASLVLTAAGVALLGVDTGFKIWDRRSNQARLVESQWQLEQTEDDLRKREELTNEERLAGLQNQLAKAEEQPRLAEVRNSPSQSMPAEESAPSPGPQYRDLAASG